MMAQKNATPTKEQAEIMLKGGIAHPFLWSVVKELSRSILVVNRLTHEFRLVDKA